MKSSIVKRSLALHGRKTSISLEADFWTALREIAEERNETLSSLIGSIDTKRRHANLSSAIRLFALDYYKGQFEGRKGKRGKANSHNLPSN